MAKCQLDHGASCVFLSPLSLSVSSWHLAAWLEHPCYLLSLFNSLWLKISCLTLSFLLSSVLPLSVCLTIKGYYWKLGKKHSKCNAENKVGGSPEHTVHTCQVTSFSEPKWYTFSALPSMVVGMVWVELMTTSKITAPPLQLPWWGTMSSVM